MKKIIALLALFFSFHASSAEAWKCSNWLPYFSNILVHTGMRSTLLTLSKPNSDINQAKIDLEKITYLINKLKTGNTFSSNKESLTFTPVLVKQGNEYLIILDECLTPIEAASLYIKMEKQGIKSSQVDIKNAHFENIPIDNVFCSPLEFFSNLFK